MSKKEWLYVASFTIVIAGIVFYAYRGENASKSPDIATDAYLANTESIYVFVADIGAKVGDEDMNGQAAQQFQAKKPYAGKVDVEETRGMPQSMVISISDSYLAEASSTGRYKFYATYNQDKKWYEVVKIQRFNAIID